MTLNPYACALRQLQYAVAESLGLWEAAERCHASQPSLSAQLAQMEQAEPGEELRSSPGPLGP